MKWIAGAALAILVGGYLVLVGGAAESQLMANQSCGERIAEGLKLGKSEASSPECQAMVTQAKGTEVVVRGMVGK